MKKYKSMKGFSIAAFMSASFLSIIALLSVTVLLFSNNKLNDMIVVHGLISLPVSLILLWTWFDTGYAIDENFLNYNAGPLWGKIPLNMISHIKIGEYNFEGFRPCLSNEAMRIDFNEGDHIYISPADWCDFIETVIYYNPKINVQ